MTGLTPGQEKTAIAYAKARAIARAGSPPSDSALADAVAIACEAAPPSAAHQVSLLIWRAKGSTGVHRLALLSRGLSNSVFWSVVVRALTMDTTAGHVRAAKMQQHADLRYARLNRCASISKIQGMA